MGVVEFFVWGIIVFGLLQGGWIALKLHRGTFSVSDDFAGIPFDKFVFGALVWPAVVVVMLYYVYSAATGGKVFKETEMLLEQKKFARESDKKEVI